MNIKNLFIQMIFTIVSIIAINIIGTGRAMAMDWMGITPLHSTKEDVEKILTNRTKSTERHSFYTLPDKTVLVICADERCSKIGDDSWNVKKGTVLFIIVSTRPAIKIGELKLDWAKFEKTQTDLSGLIEYRSNDLGITFEANFNSKTLSAITYYANKEDSIKFTCATKKSD